MRRIKCGRAIRPRRRHNASVSLHEELWQRRPSVSARPTKRVPEASSAKGPSAREVRLGYLELLKSDLCVVAAARVDNHHRPRPCAVEHAIK
jgi:hypothetical protein